MAGVVLPGCGQRVDSLLDRSSPLQVTAEFPARVERGGDGWFAGTVTVTNSGAVVEGVTSEEAGVFVVQGRTVVCTPMPQDLVARPLALASGESQCFAARASMSRCADGELLRPGDYELYAAVVVHGNDGSAVLALGGPWLLAIW